MKYLTQIQSKQTIQQSDGESVVSKEIHKSECQKNNHNMKIQSEKDQNLQTVNINIKFSQRTYRGLKIEDLLDMISKSSKSEIQKTSKLFQQLSFLLNQEPIKILDIKPTKGFLSNLVEYTRKIGQKECISQKNPMKVCKVFLNSLFYMLMLIISGGKDRYINQKLRQKLFSNKTFVKYLLAIDIYDRKQISKIYIMIVSHIYKSKPSQVMKKNLAFSIIRNLKHCNEGNSKTILNLLMILNELKFQFSLKQSQVQQYNLIQTTENIFLTNRQFSQSVHVLKYYLHLVYSFPQLDKRPNENILQKFQLSQTTKKFIIESVSYQKTYLKYLEHNICFATISELQKISDNTLNALLQFFNFSQNHFLIRNSNWIEFLLNLVKVFVKSFKSEQILLRIIEKGLIREIIKILSTKSLDSDLQTQILQVLRTCLNEVQTKFPQIHFSLLSFVLSAMENKNSKQNLIITPQYFFQKEISSKFCTCFPISMELQ